MIDRAQVKIDIQSLQFQELTFGYAHQDALLKNVTCDLPTDQVVWISGTSGSGKSVLLKILNGLMIPQSGRYLMNGSDVTQMSFEEFVPYRLNIGYSFDFGGLINNRTIYQNLTLPLEYHHTYNTEEIEEVVNEYLELFNLTNVAHERPSSIPGAFRKAACVARAFLMNPQFLLLDDPTTGLRPELRKRLKDLVLKKRQSGELKHVYVATYDSEFVKGLAEVFLEIRDQKLRFESVAKAVA